MDNNEYGDFKLLDDLDNLCPAFKNKFILLVARDIILKLLQILRFFYEVIHQNARSNTHIQTIHKSMRRIILNEHKFITTLTYIISQTITLISYISIIYISYLILIITKY